MKQIILFCLVLILSVVTCQNVQTVTIDSDELGRSIQAQIYLPPNYSTSRGPYPVMIFLHGTELDHDDYPEVITVVEEFVNGNDFPAMIVVKPNGNWQAPTPTDIWDCSSMPSWWINNDIFGNYEDFLSNELIDWLDERYDINRDYIALAGHSAGGFGAFYNGFKNPQVFSAVLSFSGVVFIDEIANDMLVTNDKWWLEYDAQGIVTLADSYTDNDKTPPPTTEQSPSLGYFSDLQWKMNYVFSPRTNDEAPFAFDKDQVDNIFVGSPDPDTIQNISIDQDTKDRWEEYNIDAILRANRKNVERLDFLYWDVGIFDGFNLQNDADAIADTIIDNNIALNYYYEQFNTGEGCDQCIPGTCPSTSYYCGGHFADRDNLSHGSCQSRFYNGLPYTGGIGSRVRVALTALAPFWSGIEVTQSATSDGSATIVTSTTRTVSDTSLSFSEISTDTSDSSNSNSNTSNTSDSSNDSSDDSSNDSSSAIALTVAFAFIFFSVLVL